MIWILHCLEEALSSLRRERRRLMPMALGIVWGMASVMVLLAIAGGFEKSQRQALMAYGDRFLLLRINRAELDRAEGDTERRLMMDSFDIDRLREGAPAIRHISPVNMAYRARITGRSGAGSRIHIAGVLPEIRQLRNIPLEEGRFFDAFDEEERRRVIVLGPRARQQLFGNGEAVGQTVRVSGFYRSFALGRRQTLTKYEAGRLGASETQRRQAPTLGSTRQRQTLAASEARMRQPVTPTESNEPMAMPGELFEVIGVLKNVEVRSESYVSTVRGAFIPYSTSTVVFDRDYNTIYIEPRTLEDRDLAVRQFREVMGARYGFEPDDENAVLVYFDAIGRARSIRAVFQGLRWFLSAVGILILAIGAIGVMNVVLVSLAARRFEIGLRKAMGATPLMISLQFFAETVISCLTSGALGFLLGIGCIAVLRGVPLPEGFAEPVLDVRVALISFGLLAGVAVVAGVYPARRAAALQPVVALQARDD